MKLLVPGGLLGRFLDLRPKVIVADHDTLADASLNDSAEGLFDVWLFTPTSADTGILEPQMGVAPDAVPVVVPYPPATKCVFAALTTAGAEKLEILRIWWAAHSPNPAGPIVRYDERNAVLVLILHDLLRSAQDEVRATAAQATAATAQIYALRCEYEQTRVVVESLQREMVRLRQRPQLLTVSMPPNGQLYVPSGGRGIIVQPLPVSAEGMAGLDLHFPEHTSVPPDAEIMVRLHALDIGRDLGTWRLGAPQLGKGWVRCWLPEVLGIASHNLEVRVEWLGTKTAISLASAGDWDENCARSLDGQEVLAGSLALTAWAGGVPGLPLTCGQIGWQGQREAAIEYSLNAEEIGRLQLHVPPVAWKPAEWFPFQQRSDGSFMLHPIGTSATTLLLPDGCPIGVNRITAIVKITSPNARGPVEYALAVSHDEEAGTLFDLPAVAAEERFLAFSSWHTIPRDNAPHVILLELKAPLDRPAHLILATRMPSGVDHAWAWADWLEVRLRVRGLSAPVLCGAEPDCVTRAA